MADQQQGTGLDANITPLKGRTLIRSAKETLDRQTIAQEIAQLAPKTIAAYQIQPYYSSIAKISIANA